MFGLGTLGNLGLNGGAPAAAPFPLDVFSGPAALAAWGTLCWSSTSVGQPLLTAGGGDYSGGADGFAAGSFSGQAVSKFYPQAGTAATLDQGTAANQPCIFPSAREGWPEVRMQNRHGTSGNKFLSVGTPPSGRVRDWTCVWVKIAQQETSISLGVLPVSQLIGSLSGVGTAMGHMHGGSDSTGDWSGHNRVFHTGSAVSHVNSNPPVHPSLRFEVMACRYTSSVDVFLNGRKSALGGTVTTSSVAPYKVGQLNDIALYSPGVAWLGVAWFPALSDAEISELSALINAKFFGFSAQPRSLWLFDGDSITAGWDGTRDRRDLSWPYELLTNLSGPQRALISGANLAQAFAHLETQVNSAHKLMLNAPGKINALVAAGSGFTNRVVVLCAGTNDIEYGTTDDTAILAKLVTYHTDALAAGATRCFICTQIPRQTNDAPKNVTLAALNASILTTFGADAIDVAGQNWIPGGSYVTNYQGGGIHPNAAGRQLFINAVGPALLAHL